MSTRLTLGTAALAALALASAAAFAQSRPAGRGTATGRYTTEQADSGARTYAIQCAMCHGANFQGVAEVPALKGLFLRNWVGRPVGDLYGYIAAAMPQHAPGSLTPEQTAGLVALLLRANGAPAGRTPLPADEAALLRIAFDPPGVQR